ncbi:hypothetical protein BJ166DRAFT_468549, partial [Pestalotiopsis sp. NC0098]
ISMDFKTFLFNKYGYDAALIIVNRLGKRSFLLLTHKTYTAAKFAKLYYEHFWRFFGTL